MEFSERGFAQHLRDFPTDYGALVSVYESSSAEGPKCWLKIEQPEPEYGGQLPKAEAVAHMTLEQAVKIRDALTEWIDFVPERWGDLEEDEDA